MWCCVGRWIRIGEGFQADPNFTKDLSVWWGNMLVILIANPSKCLLGKIIAYFTFSFFKVLYPYQEIFPEKWLGNNPNALTKKMTLSAK